MDLTECGKCGAPIGWDEDICARCCTPKGQGRLPPGHLVLNRYCVGDMIGVGGQGQVFRGTDKKTGKTVAIKVIYASLGSRAYDVFSRFEREIKLVMGLRHTNIVEYLEVDVERDMAILVMEYVCGESLGDLIRRNGANLALSDALVIFDQVLQGMHAAHAHQIVHRDIKPENILIRQSDKVVKITDFGLAKKASTGNTQLTGPVQKGPSATGQLLGTSYYMSPEQAKGITSIDAL